MKLDNRRLFINNLPNSVTEAELQQKFKDYGVVSSVEIKERKNVTGNQTKHFAYIHLEAENYTLQNCLDDFSHNKWKGHFIDVQIAKESFIERLKREREEVKINGVTKPSTSNVENHVNDLHAEKVSDAFPLHTTRHSTTIPIYPEDRKRGNNANVSVNLRKYHSSSSEDEEEEKNSEEHKTDNRKSHSVVVFDEGENELVIKNNKGSKFKKTLKIEGLGNASPSVEKESAKSGIKENQDDKKRLQSIMQMKQEYLQQKALIKNALANIDSKPKNKITFNYDDGGNDEVQPAKKVRFDENAKRKDTSSRLALFNEDDENDREYNFEVKEQFEGKKGKKLMELQSKFKNDKRFAMDARFLEDDSDENEVSPEANEEMSMEEEKNKQFDILEQVLGKKIPRTDKQTKDSKRHKMMMRFDPSQPEHSKYELKDPSTPETSKRSRKNSAKESKVEEEEAPGPEVSKDTFYKVAVNLKDALHKKEEFSLTSLFNKEIENEAQDEQQHVEDEPKDPKKHKKLNHEANPFKYDSSTDDESDNEQTNEKLTTETATEVNSATSFQRLGPTRLWTESFFFKDDDYRLQEGFDFIKKLELNEQDDFGSLRRNLKEIVRAKVRNNQRNNRPFKKKLGGKKRIRVKRALKR